MSLFQALLDLIYPPRCAVCNSFLSEEDVQDNELAGSICRICFADFRRIVPPLCPVCGRSFAPDTGESHMCENCIRKRPPYTAAGAPYKYEGAIMRAIHLFKYAGKSYLADLLGPLLAHFAAGWLQEEGNTLALPVPLHPKRLRERGFNQSLLLARHVAGRLNIHLNDLCLRRVKNTLPQTGLGKDRRRTNVRNAFEVSSRHAVKKKTVLLIDDVATTGSTMTECTRTLLKAGCKRVFCLVLARTSDF
jgi:ComF family protein